MAGVMDGEFESSGMTAFTFHSNGSVRQVTANDEEYVSDDDSMPELEDRGDISSSDDEPNNEDMPFVESDNEDTPFVTSDEPYNAEDKLFVTTINSNMTTALEPDVQITSMTQRVENGWKPNDDLETSLERERQEYEEITIRKTHETDLNNETINEEHMSNEAMFHTVNRSNTGNVVTEPRLTSVTSEINQDGPVSFSWILLDNCSTVDVFHNGELLENIRSGPSYMDIH